MRATPEVINMVTNILAKSLYLDDVKPSADLETDLGITTIGRTTIISKLNHYFDLSTCLMLDDLFQCKTVLDVCELIERRLK